MSIETTKAIFENRFEAGKRLATVLGERELDPATVVLGLPRGGVPVAREAADALQLPLDVLVVRKLGLPSQREHAMGAIGSKGVRILDEELIDKLGIPWVAVEQILREEGVELVRREQVYREGRAPLIFCGRPVVIVDDGIATGFTMAAAVEVARKEGASQVLVAVPVASVEAVDELREVADEIIALETPTPFVAVGSWYGDFPEISDLEIRACFAGDKLLANEE